MRSTPAGDGLIANKLWIVLKNWGAEMTMEPPQMKQMFVTVAGSAAQSGAYTVEQIMLVEAARSVGLGITGPRYQTTCLAPAALQRAAGFVDW